jgi:CheY-like chemotaxis protein
MAGRKGSPPRVLLAEDDEEMRKLIVHALRNDYDVTECTDGYSLFKHLHSTLELKRDESFDVVISDIRMPGLTGIENVEIFHQNRGWPPIILITAFGDKETHALAEHLGVAAVLDKPFEIADLLTKVREITESSGASVSRVEPSPAVEKQKIGFPLQIVYRSEALHSVHVERIIYRNAAKLNRFRDHITNCRIIVDIPHHHHHTGNLCRVEIILSVAGQELVVNHNGGRSGEYTDIDTAVRKKVEAAGRRLKVFLERTGDAWKQPGGAGSPRQGGDGTAA